MLCVRERERERENRSLQRETLRMTKKQKERGNKGGTRILPRHLEGLI